jgi:hypothetical protein
MRALLYEAAWCYQQSAKTGQWQHTRTRPGAHLGAHMTDHVKASFAREGVDLDRGILARWVGEGSP